MWLCSAFFVIHISMCASSVVFAMQKRLYESMERHLEAAIEKAESLARDNQQEQRQEQPESYSRISAEQSETLGMVAEPEFEYGAETFEAYQNSGKQNTFEGKSLSQDMQKKSMSR